MGMFDRILNFYTKYFAVWVILGGVAAYFWPRPFVAMGDYNKEFFAFTMFGIGAVLTVEDFKGIIKQPSVVLIGALAQYIIMPFGAFALAKIFNLPKEIAVGLILTAAAPEAMSSNVISYVAKADVAYAVSLTTVSTLACPVVTPGLTLLLAGAMVKVNFWAMFADVMYMVIVPLFIGFAVRHYFRNFISKILPVFPAVSTTFIVFICSVVIASNKEALALVTGVVLAATIILNIGGMVGGYGAAWLTGMDVKKRRTLSIEVGMQNAGLGVVLAREHFGNEATIPSAFFVFICIITAAVMAEIWRRRTP